MDSQDHHRLRLAGARGRGRFRRASFATRLCGFRFHVDAVAFRALRIAADDGTDLRVLAGGALDRRTVRHGARA